MLCSILSSLVYSFPFMPTFDQIEQAYTTFKSGEFVCSPHAREACVSGGTSKATEDADYLYRLSHFASSTCSLQCSFVSIVNSAYVHMPQAVSLLARLGRACRR
jgi:hypothetical protein